MYYGDSNCLYAAGIGSTFLLSHDYDAPLTEPGDFTDTFMKVRDVSAKYCPGRAILVKESPKLSLDPLAFTESIARAIAPEVIARAVQSSE
jgi:hypothetical protein